jgi:hypothetical protein
MKLIPSYLKLEAYQWFLEREPLIPQGANRPEMETRLKWLSEGSLHYHLSKFKSGEPPCPMEVALYNKFVESDPPLLKRYTKPHKR